MCGLVGTAGDLSLDAVKVFKQLLYVDALRGEDNTGVAALGPKGATLDIVKCVGPAVNLLDSKRFDAIVNPGKYILIGHNRYGTIGGKTIANAHPFEHGNIVGAHNGTLEYQARKRLGTEDKFGTDSEQLIHSINEIGVKETVAKITGAWAVVFYDREKNTINLFRNRERDLWYAFSESRKQLFWASERWMLVGVLARNGIKFDEVHQLPIDQHLGWVVPIVGQVFNDDNVPVLSQLKEHTTVNAVVPRFPVFSGGKKAAEEKKKTELVPWPDEGELTDEQLDFMCGWNPQRVGTSATINTPTVKPKTYLNPRTGVLMTREEFDDITGSGCDWCSSNIVFGSNCRFKCDGGEIESFCEDCTQGRDGLNRYLNAKG